MNIFWGYENFVDIFLGSLQNWRAGCLTLFVFLVSGDG